MDTELTVRHKKHYVSSHLVVTSSTAWGQTRRVESKTQTKPGHQEYQTYIYQTLFNACVMLPPVAAFLLNLFSSYSLLNW